jgi:hypothetical protein
VERASTLSEEGSTAEVTSPAFVAADNDVWANDDAGLRRHLQSLLLPHPWRQWGSSATRPPLLRRPSTCRRASWCPPSRRPMWPWYVSHVCVHDPPPPRCTGATTGRRRLRSCPYPRQARPNQRLGWLSATRRPWRNLHGHGRRYPTGSNPPPPLCASGCGSARGEGV